MAQRLASVVLEFAPVLVAAGEGAAREEAGPFRCTCAATLRQAGDVG